MLRMRPALILFSFLAAGLLVSACSDDDPVTPPGNIATNPMPDFSMADMNPTSATFAQGVSPRDHLQKVSAWYFGHST